MSIPMVSRLLVELVAPQPPVVEVGGRLRPTLETMTKELGA